jgi:F-box protein 36
VDYLARIPEALLLKIVSHLSLEDVSRLAQTNKKFREVRFFARFSPKKQLKLVLLKLCRSDRVWIQLYERYYSKEITKELLNLAQKKGWRTIFFTNKIRLQVRFDFDKTL